MKVFLSRTGCWLLAACVCASLLLSPVLAREKQAIDPAKAKWLAVFEQSYGTEGLYVLELYPSDPGAKSRLNLQLLNAAALQYQAEYPGEPISFERIIRRGLLADPLEPLEGEEYAWDDDAGYFRSSLGGVHNPEFGAPLLLNGNDQIRRRIIHPDGFARKRWQKIYADAGAPEFLKREILLREFFLANFHFPEAEMAEVIHRRLLRLDDAIKLYVVSSGKDIGDPLTKEELEDSGFLKSLERMPEGTEISLPRAGESPIAVYKEMTITVEPDAVMVIRRKHAFEAVKGRSDFPPAIALWARFQPPDKALELLDQAIKIWPDVVGLRVERMTYQARLGRFRDWTGDLDYIFDNFPAAPVLIEIQILAEVSGIASDPQSASDFAVLLADVRPDLLTHQLFAIRTLEEAGKIEEAQSIYDRLAYSNPVWRVALRRPADDGETSTTSPEEE